MKLEEMSGEELVSNHEQLCEIHFLRDDDIDEELRNSFSEIISRLTRGDKAIKAIVNKDIRAMADIEKQYRREYEEV